MLKAKTRSAKAAILSIIGLLAIPTLTQAEPLKIGYSDWPGWVAWQIGIEKGWFEEEIYL